MENTFSFSEIYLYTAKCIYGDIDSEMLDWIDISFCRHDELLIEVARCSGAGPTEIHNSFKGQAGFCPHPGLDFWKHGTIGQKYLLPIQPHAKNLSLDSNK